MQNINSNLETNQFILFVCLFSFYHRSIPVSVSCWLNTIKIHCPVRDISAASAQTKGQLDTDSKYGDRHILWSWTDTPIVELEQQNFGEYLPVIIFHL